MASPSSSMGKDKELEEKKEKKDNKSEEKKEEDDKGNEKSKRSGNSDMHVKLDDELIRHLQNMKNWQEKKIVKWSVAEKEIEEMSMKTYDFDYVLKNHLLDEEIVWDDDVWGLQNIIKIPPTSHAKKD